MTRHLIMLLLSLIVAPALAWVLVRFLKTLKKIEEESWGVQKKSDEKMTIKQRIAAAFGGF